MRINTLIIVITCICLTTACAVDAASSMSTNNNTTGHNGLNFSPIAHAHTAELLDFINHYTESSKEVQKKTYMSVMQALASDKENVKLKIKHAAILTMPKSSLRNTSAAKQHLEALLTNTNLSKSNTHLVKLLHTFLLDHTESKKLRESAKKVEALKQKNKVLSQKLKDLKDIEKTMIKGFYKCVL